MRNIRTLGIAAKTGTGDLQDSDSTVMLVRTVQYSEIVVFVQFCTQEHNLYINITECILMFADYWDLQRLDLDKSVSVTTVLHILAANILNKQSRTEVEGWSYRFGDGRGAN